MTWAKEKERMKRLMRKIRNDFIGQENHYHENTKVKKNTEESRQKTE